MRLLNVRTALWALGLAVAAIVGPFLWPPYRVQNVVAISDSTGACTVGVNQVSGWQTKTLSLGIKASEVAYPLSVFAFADCSGEKPFNAELVSTSGVLIANGLECGRSLPSRLPCRVEVPPIAAPSSPHRLLFRVTPKEGDGPEYIGVQITTPRRWESLRFAWLMSV